MRSTEPSTAVAMKVQETIEPEFRANARVELDSGLAIEERYKRLEVVNDPLSDWTQKEIYQECVWISDESSTTKIFVLCLSRFFDDDAKSSSMSYKQVARECGLHETTAKAIAKKLAGKWIRIHLGRGHYVVGKGRTNLYDAITPPDLVARLRAILGERAGSSDTTSNGDYGVTSHYLELERGRLTRPRHAFSGSSETQAGSSETTRTTHTPREHTHTKDRPHMNGVGFVISKGHNLFVSSETVVAWKRRFPEIDLESKLENLASKIRKGGPIHPGWGEPAWMAGPLSEENSKALNARLTAEAKREAVVAAERELADKRVRAYDAKAADNRANAPSPPTCAGATGAGLIAAIAESACRPVEDLDWLAKLFAMKRQKDIDLFTWGMACIEQVDDLSPDVLRRAVKRIIHKNEWLPAHSELATIARDVAAKDERARELEAAPGKIREVETELEAQWERMKNDPPDAKWRQGGDRDAIDPTQFYEGEEDWRLHWCHRYGPASDLISELGGLIRLVVAWGGDAMATTYSDSRWRTR